eukprot:scaffold42367_cov61-Phaeocystis_antarctica.AAC.1
MKNSRSEESLAVDAARFCGRASAAAPGIAVELEGQVRGRHWWCTDHSGDPDRGLINSQESCC